MKDPALHDLYNKYYGNKKRKGDKSMSEQKSVEVKNEEIKNDKEVKPIIEKKVVEKKVVEKKFKKTIVKKPIIKKERKERKVTFKTRPTGIFRLSDKHMKRFGFKPKQELEIVNNKPGEIIVKIKSVIK